MTSEQLAAGNALANKQSLIKSFAKAMREKVSYISQWESKGLDVAELTGYQTSLIDTWEAQQIAETNAEFAKL